MSDLFGRTNINVRTPLTADKATIDWGGVVTAAIQISISYQQPVNRRRTIGNKDAVIWASLPAGQITIQRMMTTDSKALFNAPGWNASEPLGTISLSLQNGQTFKATGAIVTQFNVSAEAESLTIMDNVTIEFLQLFS